MAYSLSLLSHLQQLPNFLFIEEMKKEMDDAFKAGKRVCNYPILPVGIYRITPEKPSLVLDKASNLENKTYALFAASLFIGVIGCCLNDRKWTLLLALPLTFLIFQKIYPISKKIKIVATNNDIIIHHHPVKIPSPFSISYLTDRQQAHAMITGLYDE